MAIFNPENDVIDTVEFYKNARGNPVVESPTDRDFFAVCGDVGVLEKEIGMRCRGIAVKDGDDLWEACRAAKTEVLRRAMSLVQANNTDAYIKQRGYYFDEGRFLQGGTKVGLKYMPTEELYKSEGGRIRNYVCKNMRENGFGSASVTLNEETGGLFIVVDMKEIAKKMVPYLDQSSPLVTE